MKKTTIRVTLLLLTVLIITVWNGLRLWTSLAWLDVINQYSPQPTIGITITSGVVWFIVGLLLIWSIWQNKDWADKMLLWAGAGYTVWYWSERLIWQNPHPNWLFAVIVNLAIIIFILFTRKSMAREAYERKIENPETE